MGARKKAFWPSEIVIVAISLAIITIFVIPGAASAVNDSESSSSSEDLIESPCNSSQLYLDQINQTQPGPAQQPFPPIKTPPRMVPPSAISVNGSTAPGPAAMKVMKLLHIPPRPAAGSRPPRYPKRIKQPLQTQQGKVDDNKHPEAGASGGMLVNANNAYREPPPSFFLEDDDWREGKLGKRHRRKGSERGHRKKSSGKRSKHKKRRIRRQFLRKPGSAMHWDNFHRFGAIEAWMDDVARRNSKFVRIRDIGKTYEKRSLKVLEINTANSKDVFWIDAGIHAREWAAPAVATYIIDQLVNNYAGNKALVDSYRWYIMPVHNPDGYEYTHTHDRMWRKNRSKRGKNIKCPGVDLNRNWNFHWGVGASKDPCSEVYQGPTPESEEEVKAVRNFIQRTIRAEVPSARYTAFYTYHSYGPAWLIPFGHTHDDPPGYAKLLDVARVGASAIKRKYGTSYELTRSSKFSSPASGASDDWAYGVAGFQVSYTIELSGNGRGFKLAKGDIKRVVEEAFDGLAASAARIKKYLA